MQHLGPAEGFVKGFLLAHFLQGSVTSKALEVCSRYLPRALKELRQLRTRSVIVGKARTKKTHLRNVAPPEDAIQG